MYSRRRLLRNTSEGVLHFVQGHSVEALTIVDHTCLDRCRTSSYPECMPLSPVDAGSEHGSFFSAVESSLSFGINLCRDDKRTNGAPVTR